MDTEPPRLALGLSALGGATFWGLYHVATLWRAGKAIEPQHFWRAMATIAMGMVAGVLAAIFLGPALTGLVPIAGLRDPHVVGFVIGAGAWETAPFALRFLRGRAAKLAKDEPQ